MNKEITPAGQKKSQTIFYKKKMKSDFTIYTVSHFLFIIMIKQLEFDIKQIETNLKILGFQFPPSVVENHNRINTINLQLKEISTVLTGECRDYLFENVELVTGAVTATYCLVRTLNEAVVSIEKSRKYIEQYLKP